MSDLPIKDYKFYAACDPGFSGAIAVMNAEGTTAKVWDMPLKEMGEMKHYRGLDLDALDAIFRILAHYPDLVIGLENPTTRPGEGAERSARFGRQLGTLESFAYCFKLPYHKISPNLWKSRLGLDGKTVEGSNERAAGLFCTYYPERKSLIYGPRGGIMDGRMDALLIAHFLRTRGSGMKTVAEKFGKDSMEMFTLVMGGGRRKRKQSLTCKEE